MQKESFPVHDIFVWSIKWAMQVMTWGELMMIVLIAWIAWYGFVLLKYFPKGFDGFLSGRGGVLSCHHVLDNDVNTLYHRLSSCYPKKIN